MYRDVPKRLLHLLALLQSRREWTGGELADRLGVTDRTIRRDVDRLRQMGYGVESLTGAAGGYTLASGKDLPPLLLDGQEAVAIAVALLIAGGGLQGAEESGPRALAKLLPLLPARLRAEVSTVADATISMSGPKRQTTVDPLVLTSLSGAIRDREILRLKYRSRDGQPSIRIVEPYHVVTGAGLWYAVAFDLDVGWRILRIDRIERSNPMRRRFEPRRLPANDPTDFVLERLRRRPSRYAVRAIVDADREQIRRWLPNALPSRLKSHGATTIVELDADDATFIARDLLALHAPFSIEATDEVAVALQHTVDRLGQAVRNIYQL